MDVSKARGLVDGGDEGGEGGEGEDCGEVVE